MGTGALWLAGVLLAGIIVQPTAFQGDDICSPRLRPLCSGNVLAWSRGYLVATAVAALFLSQLEQFVLALGVSFAVRTLVEAAALAVGVALYTVNWKALRERLFGFLSQPAATLGDDIPINVSDLSR